MLTGLDNVIIAVEGGGPTGGAERIAFDTVRLLSEEGINVTIVSSAKAVDPAYAGLKGVEVICLDLPLHFNRFFALGKKEMIFNLLEDRELKALFKSTLAKLDSKNTILHAHGFHNCFTQAILHVATGLEMKTVVTCHDFGITCPTATLFNYPQGVICPLKPLSNACLKSDCMGPDAKRLKQLRFARTWASNKLHLVPQKVAKVLAVSDHEREILQSHFGTKVKVETLFNPVEPAATERQNPSISRSFLWIGRMTKEKDGITPAKVCDDLGHELTFVGDGPMRSEIEHAYPAAKFLGWVSSDDVKSEQCKARALILSSRWHETASLVVLECLAAGIPCVIPSTSAATNWIEDGYNGLFFEAGNEESLAQALKKLESDDFVEQLSKNAFNRYWNAPFTLDRYKSDLFTYYQEALKS
ncbi:MAG: glycosyltransferase family 4 protein [Armatimonadota bacterium]